MRNTNYRWKCGWIAGLALALSHSAFSQAQISTKQALVEPCSYESWMEELIQQDPALEDQIRKQEERIQAEIQQGGGTASKGAAQTIYTIPVVIHIFHTGQQIDSVGAGLQGVQNPSFEAINIAVKQVTNDYAALGKNAEGAPRNSRAADVGIRFVLAMKDPNGVYLPGGAITRWNGALSSTWTGAVTAGQESATASAYANYGVKRSGSNGITANTLKAVVQWPVTKYYNIYLVTEIDDNGGGSGTQGFASFPGTGSGDYAVMVPDAFDGRKASIGTFDHEMAHALSLQHTFRGAGGAENGSSNTYCPPIESNCSTDGDRVCDIPTHHSMLGQDCKAEDTPNDCPGGTGVYGDFQDNYMNYTNCSPNFFSAGQATRMRTVMTTDNARKNQTTPSNLKATGADRDLPAQADFQVNGATYDGFLTYKGNTVQFLDSSIKASFYMWNFGDGDSSSEKNPVHQYKNSGKYTVTLKINGGGGMLTKVKTNYVTIIPNRGTQYSLQNGGDFESNVGDFNAITYYGTPWEYGTSTNNFSVKYGYNSSANAWVTGKDEYYRNYTESYLYTPEYDFSLAGKYVLSFYTKFQLENSKDGFIVEYTTNKGASWTKLGSTKATGWYNDEAIVDSKVFTTGEAFFSGQVFPSFLLMTYNASALAGNASIAFRFTFKTGMNNTNSLVREGIVIDDFTIKYTEAKVAKFKADKTTICNNESVTFTDESTGNPTTWSWNFGVGATPSTATGPGPHTVTYSTAGTSTVSLDVENGESIETKTSYVAINAFPQEKTLSASPASICPNGSTVIKVQASEAGVTYQLRKDADNSNAAPSQIGTGNDLSFTVSGIASTTVYNAKATKEGCVSTLTSKSTVTTKDLPVDRTISVQDPQLCISNSGTAVIVKSAENGITYQLRDDKDNSAIGSAQAGAAGDLSLPTGTIGSTKTFNVLAKNTANCVLLLSTKPTVKINQMPENQEMSTKDNKVCPGGSSAVVLSNSQSNVSYQLKNSVSGDLLGSVVAGRDGAIELPTGSLTASTTFLVNAYNGCSRDLDARPVINMVDTPQHRPVTVEQNELCEQGSTVFTISGSESEINYVIKKTSTNSTVKEVKGTGSTISFPVGPIAKTETYKILAQLTGCEREMNDHPTVTILSINELKGVTVNSPALCDSGECVVNVLNSEEGVLYQLKIDGASIGTAIAGTGETVSLPSGMLKKNTTFSVLGINKTCSQLLNGKPSISVNKAGGFTITGSGNELRAPAGGSGHQWYFNGNAIAGATKSSLKVTEYGIYEVEMTINSCKGRSEQYRYGVVSTLAKLPTTSIQVYPNPGTSFVKLEIPAIFQGNIDLRLSSSAGQQVLLKRIQLDGKDNNTLLDISELPQGIYFLEVWDDQHVVHRSIAKTN